MTSATPTALVVGATGGIGAAIARELGRTHAVWLAGRDQARLDAEAQKMGARGTWVVDLAAPTCAPSLPEELTTIDVLVLAAGAWAFGSTAETDDAVWRDVFAVNLFGQVAVTRCALPALRTRGGRVIVVNSTAIFGSPGRRAVYASSKAALKVFAEALHEEERAHGIQVTSLYPGRVATAMQEAVTRSEGGEYAPENYLTPETFARTARIAVDLDPDAHIAELTVRPPFLTRA